VPDYYLELITDQGSIRTKNVSKTRAWATALTWKLPVPVPLSAVKELRVYDENIGNDKMMDRISAPSRENQRGKNSTSPCKVRFPQARTNAKSALALAICGGAILLLTFLKFIRAQVL